MRTFVVFLGLLGFALATVEIILEEEDGSLYEVNAEDNIAEKAAPWWEQQEELAKRRCQSSCTMHSKGVKEPQITLCDDTNVSLRFLHTHTASATTTFQESFRKPILSLSVSIKVMVHIISANEVYSVEVVAKLRWWDGSTIMVVVVLRHYYAKQRQMSGVESLFFCAFVYLRRESAVFQQSGSFSISSLKIRSSKSKQNRLGPKTSARISVA